MTKQTHTPLTALGSYGNYSVANVADLAMTAADVGNKEQVVASGKDLIVAYNTGASAHTITVTSTIDPYNRTGDISAYSLGAGEFAVFGPLATTGWIQTDGKIYFEANHAEIKFGVVRLP